MNGFEFTATILAAVFWPTALIFVAVLFRSQIQTLLPNVKSAKVGPVAFEIEHKLEEAAAKTEVTVTRRDQSIIVQRLQRNASLLHGARVLWVDDDPKNNIELRQILESYGAHVRVALNTDAAMSVVKDRWPDVVVSDMERDGNAQAGLDLAHQVVRRDPSLRPVFFVGRVKPGVPPNAHGITNRFDEALHLILDVLERRRSEL